MFLVLANVVGKYIIYIYRENDHGMGKSTIWRCIMMYLLLKWWFSIAILLYQRVNMWVNTTAPIECLWVCWTSRASSNYWLPCCWPKLLLFFDTNLDPQVDSQEWFEKKSCRFFHIQWSFKFLWFRIFVAWDMNKLCLYTSMCKSIIIHIYFNRNQIDNPQKLVMFPEHSSGKEDFSQNSKPKRVIPS